MRNLVLTLLVAPLFCMMQLSADLEIIEIDPSSVIVDDGLYYLDEEGNVIPVQNLIVRHNKVLAVTTDESEIIDQSGWIFMFPPDALKYFDSNQPMAHIATATEEKNCSEEPCDCGCAHEKEAKTFVKTQGMLNNWLQNILRNSGDRNYPIQTNSACSCRAKKGNKSYIHQASGDVIISINLEEEVDEYDDQVVRIYINDEEVSEILLSNTSEYEEELEEEIEELYEELQEVYEEEVDLIIGYDPSGAFYYNPNSFFELQSPENYRPYK